MRVGRLNRKVLLLAILLLIACLIPMNVTKADSGITHAVLIHGYNADKSVMSHISDMLLKWGWTVDNLEYYGTIQDWPSGSHENNKDTSIKTLAHDVAAMVNAKYDKYGGEPITIIAHSMGGLITRAMLQYETWVRTPVESVLMLGTPNDGSPWAKLAKYTGIDRTVETDEMSSGSDFLKSLQKKPGSSSIRWGTVAGTDHPWYSFVVFGWDDNDGVVSVNSVESINPDQHWRVDTDHNGLVGNDEVLKMINQFCTTRRIPRAFPVSEIDLSVYPTSPSVDQILCVTTSVQDIETLTEGRTVDFYVNGALIGNRLLDNSGVATIKYIPETAGLYNFTAFLLNGTRLYYGEVAVQVGQPRIDYTPYILVSAVIVAFVLIAVFIVTQRTVRTSKAIP